MLKQLTKNFYDHINNYYNWKGAEWTKNFIQPSCNYSTNHALHYLCPVEYAEQEIMKTSRYNQ